MYILKQSKITNQQPNIQVEEQTKPKAGRRKEIITIRAQVNKIVNKKNSN